MWYWERKRYIRDRADRSSGCGIVVKRERDCLGDPVLQRVHHNRFFLDHVFSSVGITVIPREIEDNGYAKILGGKQDALWSMWKWRTPEKKSQRISSVSVKTLRTRYKWTKQFPLSKHIKNNLRTFLFSLLQSYVLSYEKKGRSLCPISTFNVETTYIRSPARIQVSVND